MRPPVMFPVSILCGGGLGVLALHLLFTGQPAGFVAMLLAACLAALAPILFARFRPAAQPKGQAGPMDLVETLVGAVIRFKPDGAPSYVSRSASEVFGCRPFELSGAGLFERVHVMDRPAYRRAIADVAEGGTRVSLEIRMRRDGQGTDAGSHYVWVELALAPAGDAQGGVLGVMRDVSARKGVEDDLRRAREQAEDASEAKSRFLATIGHELRTPLNAIVGFSDMMVEGIGGELSPTHREYAGHIRQSGHHLLDVVNMLLDMSRIEAGKFELQAEPFAPHALVEPCLQIVEKLGQDRAIAVEALVPERLPQIVGDERACRQIVINLLSNAIKFSHPGGSATLAMKRQGRMLNISVSDTGIGMQPETIRRIGEPFLQAQDGLARRYEGTGLGLSIVKGLVSLHGGKLDVVSEPGLGTTVTVLLPLDGPSSAGQQTATIALLHKEKRDSDEHKWLEDERKSAAL